MQSRKSNFLIKLVSLTVVLVSCPIRGVGQDLHQLSSLHNDELKTAIGAAWERLASTSKSPNPGAQLNRFVGFLEGRLCVDIPISWEEALLSSSFSKDKQFHLGFTQKATFSSSRTSHIQISNGFQLVDNDGWKLRGKTVEIPLPGLEPKSHELKIGNSRYNCRFMCVWELKNNDGVVIGFPIDSPKPYPICLIGTDGNLLWQSKIQCGERRESSNIEIGFMQPQVEFESNEKPTLFLFGMASGTAYIESINIADGKTQSVFSSFEREKQSNNK